MPDWSNEYLLKLREQRSSESNFETICTTLADAGNSARQNNETSLAEELKEVDEKYASEYRKAKDTGGNAWPEFEKFVTHFERALTNARKPAA